MPPAVFATPPTPLPRVEVTNVTGLLSFVEGMVVVVAVWLWIVGFFWLVFWMLLGKRVISRGDLWRWFGLVGLTS